MTQRVGNIAGLQPTINHVKCDDDEWSVQSAVTDNDERRVVSESMIVEEETKERNLLAKIKEKYLTISTGIRSARFWRMCVSVRVENIFFVFLKDHIRASDMNDGRADLLFFLRL